MSDTNNNKLFRRLTRLFRSGPLVKRKLRSIDTHVARPDPGKSNGYLLFSKAQSPTYSTITNSAYNIGERLIRFQDYIAMEQTPEIAACLDIYADEIVACDENNHSLHVFSENEKIKEELEELFYHIVNVEFNLRPWARNLPVRWNSVIPLLDGRNLTIKDLSAEVKTKKETWVYSVNTEGRLVPGLVTWCDMTCSKSKIVRVHLDDGSYVDMSPEHEVILRDGTSVKAENLTPGTSLMPFYRRLAKVGKHDGYEKVYDPQYGYHVYTHRRVAESLKKEELSNNDQCHVTHHIDINKRNNHPKNLRRMGNAAHSALHQELSKMSGSMPFARSEVKEKAKKGRDRWLRSERHKILAKEQLLLRQEQGLMPRNYGAYSEFTILDEKCIEIVREHIKNMDGKKSLKRLCTVLQNDDVFKQHFLMLNVGKGGDRLRTLNTPQSFGSLLSRTVGRKYYEEFNLPKPPRLNHKVVSVETLDELDEVFCMDVRGPNGEHDRHNFMVLGISRDGSPTIDSGICVSNCKYGDLFTFLDVRDGDGVQNVIPIPVNEIEREENFDPNNPFAVRFRWTQAGNRILENWEVAHFRLQGNDMFLPYGASVIEPARRIWRQLILAEDAMLVYRVTRAPERRVFYVDVANLRADEVENYVEEQRRNIRTNSVSDPSSGRADIRYNPFCFSSKTIIPLLDGRRLKIKDLVAEWNEGKRDQETYTLDLARRGQIVPGKIVWAGSSGITKQMAEITLDDGSVLRVTPDHKMMLRNGDPIKAKDLKPGTSLMPGHMNLGFERKTQISNLLFEELKTFNENAWDETCKIHALKYLKKQTKFVALRKFAESLEQQQDFSRHYADINPHSQKVSKSFRVEHIEACLVKDYLDWSAVWAVHNPFALGREFINNVDSEVIALESANNHKVVSVNVVDVEEEVFNVTIDLHYNLLVQAEGSDAVSNAGMLFTFQSVDEDFIIPRRGKESGTEIVPLAGGANTAAIEDVAYLQKKLFAALKIPKAYLGFDEPACFTADTKIALLNGSKTIQELANLDWDNTQQDVWTYSCDPQSGKIVPSRVLRAWETKRVDKLYRITLDSGNVIECTDNHPFLGRDGNYVRADQLVVGQSLMPLYRKRSSKRERDFQDGYEKVFDNEKQDWVYTHRLVAHEIELAKDESWFNESRRVIHHVDNDKTNNIPSNLLHMGRTAHALHHSDQASILLLPSSRDALRKTMKTEKYRAKLIAGVRQAWARDDGSRRVAIALANTKYKRKDYDVDVALQIAKTCSTTTEFYSRLGLSKTGFCNATRRKGIDPKNWLEQNVKKLKNHKVLSIDVIELTVEVPVYDIEVERHHNFATCGFGCLPDELGGYVFVHNSKASLAQLDIRFSRTISAIQRTMVSELNKIAMVHLLARGYDGEELVNFTLKLSNPSTIAQQQKLELWRAKFEIAATAPENVVSKAFIRKEVWGLSDKDCKLIDSDRYTEKVIDSTIESMTVAESGGGGDGAADAGDDFGADLEEPIAGDDDATEPDSDTGDEPVDLETAESEPEEELDPELELLTSADDPEAPSVRLTLNKSKLPVNVSAQIQRTRYNAGRRRHHGASSTHMPDLHKMTSGDTREMQDPHDYGYVRSVVSNPFGEARVKTSMSPDVRTTLTEMKSRFLVESRMRQDEIEIDDKLFTVVTPAEDE